MMGNLLDDAAPLILERINAIVACATVAALFHLLGLNPNKHLALAIIGAVASQIVAKHMVGWYTNHQSVRYKDQIE